MYINFCHDVFTGPFFASISGYLNQLQRGQHLESFQFLKGSYLIPPDGSEYFFSKNISCPGCLKKEKSAEDIRYHHRGWTVFKAAVY